MNTKPVPAIVMLITGFVACIVSICKDRIVGAGDLLFIRLYRQAGA